jgi:hypothetical protein
MCDEFVGFSKGSLVADISRAVLGVTQEGKNENEK